MSIEKEFKKEVQNHLNELNSNIKPVLKELIKYNYPKEVVSLEFEIFADRFTSEFPVRAFFMDKENSEHFVYVNGQAEYPSPVEPKLLEIECIYSYELEEEYSDMDDNLDLWSIATDELVEWFSKCWNEVGGKTFKLKANISSHDDIKEYNLVEGTWQER